MNIQDYQWQTVEKDGVVYARIKLDVCTAAWKRASQRVVSEQEYADLCKLQKKHTYEILNLSSGQIIDGKELELVQDEFPGLFLRHKTQPIEDKKETLNGHYHIIDAIVQKTLECFIENYIDERINDVGNDVDIDKSNRNGRLQELKLIKEKLPLMREDILKQLTANQ